MLWSKPGTLPQPNKRSLKSVCVLNAHPLTLFLGRLPCGWTAQGITRCFKWGPPEANAGSKVLVPDDPQLTHCLNAILSKIAVALRSSKSTRGATVQRCNAYGKRHQRGDRIFASAATVQYNIYSGMKRRHLRVRPSRLTASLRPGSGRPLERKKNMLVGFAKSLAAKKVDSSFLLSTGIFGTLDASNASQARLINATLLARTGQAMLVCPSQSWASNLPIRPVSSSLTPDKAPQARKSVPGPTAALPAESLSLSLLLRTGCEPECATSASERV